MRTDNEPLLLLSGTDAVTGTAAMMTCGLGLPVGDPRPAGFFRDGVLVAGTPCLDIFRVPSTDALSGLLRGWFFSTVRRFDAVCGSDAELFADGVLTQSSSSEVCVSSCTSLLVAGWSSTGVC